MIKATDDTNLTGHCLIAMPDMPDTRFRSALIYLCAHSDEGAMGIIVNKPAPNIKLGDLLDQLSIDKGQSDVDTSLHFGGPVDAGRGFVLHSPDFHSGLSTLKVTEDVSLTSTMDILEEVSAGNGPSQALYALGYSGWGAGQLESEIAANGWLICTVEQEVLFTTPADRKWSAALHGMGIDPAILSSSGGSA